MERILALYDSDVFYATKFMEYFNKKNETDFTVSVFTQVESIENFLQLHQVEILLAGDSMKLNEQLQKNIRHVYQLSDIPPSEADSSVYQLSKYQSVRALMNQILSDYQVKEDVTPGRGSRRQTNITSVFPLVPGQDKLSFAWSLSLLRSDESRVLFVLLDLFPVPLLFQTEKEHPALSEFIYYLKETSGIAKLKSLLGQYGRLSYLSGIQNGADILSLSSTDMQKWVEELRNNSDYDTVIFYQSCYTEAMTELMKLSDTVLVTSLDNSYEAAIGEEWNRQMSQLDINTNRDKYCFIQLQEQEEWGQLPITISELMGSTSWYDAKQYLNTYEN